MKNSVSTQHEVGSLCVYMNVMWLPNIILWSSQLQNSPFCNFVVIVRKWLWCRILGIFPFFACDYWIIIDIICKFLQILSGEMPVVKSNRKNWKLLVPPINKISRIANPNTNQIKCSMLSQSLWKTHTGLIKMSRPMKPRHRTRINSCRNFRITFNRLRQNNNSIVVWCVQLRWA